MARISLVINGARYNYALDIIFKLNVYLYLSFDHQRSLVRQSEKIYMMFYHETKYLHSELLYIY